MNHSLHHHSQQSGLSTGPQLSSSQPILLHNHSMTTTANPSNIVATQSSMLTNNNNNGLSTMFSHQQQHHHNQQPTATNTSSWPLNFQQHTFSNSNASVVHHQQQHFRTHLGSNTQQQQGSASSNYQSSSVGSMGGMGHHHHQHAMPSSSSSSVIMNTIPSSTNNSMGVNHHPMINMNSSNSQQNMFNSLMQQQMNSNMMNNMNNNTTTVNNFMNNNNQLAPNQQAYNHQLSPHNLMFASSSASNNSNAHHTVMGNQVLDNSHNITQPSHMVDSMINPSPTKQPSHHLHTSSLNNNTQPAENENIFSLNTFFRYANNDVTTPITAPPTTTNRAIVQNSTLNTPFASPTMVNIQNNPQKWSQPIQPQQIPQAMVQPVLVKAELSPNAPQTVLDQNDDEAPPETQDSGVKGGIKITRNIRADTCVTPNEPVEYPKHGVLYVYNVESWTDKNSFYDKIAYSFGTPSTQKKVHCSYLNCKVMHYERTCQGVYYCPHKDDDGNSCIVRPCRLRFHTCQKHNNNSLTKSGKCPFKLHFYVPLDKTDHRRLLLCLGTHNHPLLSESDCMIISSQANEKKSKQTKSSTNNNNQTSQSNTQDSKSSTLNAVQSVSSFQEPKQSMSRVSSTNSIQSTKLKPQSNITNMNMIPSRSATPIQENISTMNYNQNSNSGNNFMTSMGSMPNNTLMNNMNIISNPSMAPQTQIGNIGNVNNTNLPMHHMSTGNYPSNILPSSSNNPQNYLSASEALMNPPPKTSLLSATNTMASLHRSSSQEILGSGLTPTHSSPLGRSPSLSPPYSYSSPHTPNNLPTKSNQSSPYITAPQTSINPTPISSTKKLASLFQPSDYLQHVSKPPSYSKTLDETKRVASSLMSSSPNFMSSSSPSLYSYSNSPSPRVDMTRSPSYTTNPTPPSPPHMLVSPMNPGFPALSPSYFCDNNFSSPSFNSYSSPQQIQQITQSPSQLFYKTESPASGGMKRERVYTTTDNTNSTKKVKQEDSVLPPIESIVD